MIYFDWCLVDDHGTHNYYRAFDSVDVKEQHSAITGISLYIITQSSKVYKVI